MPPIPDLAIAIGFGLLLGWCLILTAKLTHLTRSHALLDRWTSLHAKGEYGAHSQLERSIVRLGQGAKALDAKHRRRNRDDSAHILRSVSEALQRIAHDSAKNHSTKKARPAGDEHRVFPPKPACPPNTYHKESRR